LEIAIEGAHVLDQCASDLCRNTAAQYIKSRDGTTIPYVKGGRYRDFFIVLDSIEHTFIYREATIDVWVHINSQVTFDMRRAYAIGVLYSIEDTLKVHMYWLNVQGLRVKAFVVFCLLFNVCCLGHSCRSTAARYIKISDRTIILQPKGRHYRDFLNFMFEMPLGTLKLHPKGRHYRIFLSFKFHWALLACLRWSLGTLGLPWVPLDGHWGSICHLWGSMGVPLARRWAPFVAFGAPFWRLWLSLGVTLEALCDRLLQKTQQRKRSKVFKLF